MKKLFCLLTLITSIHAFSQPFAPEYFNAMKWRMIGPHRAGRTVGATGVPSQPNVFYMGVNNGGVWKTTDFGRTWIPIFDDQPTGSIGDIVVSPSNPNVIYVGSGEGLQRPDLSVGDGMYKSVDGGKTWSHIGLREGQQIGGMALDPENENRLFVAVLGHPYGPNKERGVYRTLDGGKTWKQVLYKDENTGAIQVTIDPKNPNIVYADLWAGRQGPWENGAWNGPESGLFKSTDGGETWVKLEKGLPTTAQGLGRIGFCIAPSDPNRLYATVDAGDKPGIYRSDDAGASWQLIQSDPRYWGRGADFAEVKVDPTNKDIVYSANVVTWKSTDGGMNWTAFRGAPGGDDYHRIWINPNNNKIILFASDQGAIITVNGGETFSSWYNQPTAQFYHVSTDNAFPYNVYGGQQESGSVGIVSRGNDGFITYREWHPVGVEEYGYVAADPLDPNIIYGGKITRHDKRTGQTQNIAPEAVRSGNYRFIRTAPVLFSPIDPKTLFFAGNVLFKTRDGGMNWSVISPDLSRSAWDIPASVGVFTTEQMKTMPRRGVIYTVAPSFKDSNTIWCGTDDGLIHVTRNGGKQWMDVTPSSITSWSKVSLMEASHFDVNTAYAAVNRIRLDDMKPHIYKTHDGGKTWKEIVQGLPDDPINTVREDPVRKGLLYAGSERAVYVSFDDGEHWQSLRLNMPATSIRDLVIKDDDIVVGTHGRSFWILDDITPLRQISSALSGQPMILYKPQQAWRVRWSTYTDTPVPQEEPAGENPPDGAVINYHLSANASQVKLEILDNKGKLVRTYSSNDKPYTKPQDNVPDYWVRPQQILSAKAGAHRFSWDMHYDQLDIEPTFPISAVYKNTPPDPTSPWVMPGTYTARLTIDGKMQTQTFVVKMDPRVKT
ncbi:MAG: VPS10 domain-containing protein, partial [Sphingobacteriales bacterium]